ncbi:MAG: family 20 glycosylhydrolase, partial [bacterium]
MKKRFLLLNQLIALLICGTLAAQTSQAPSVNIVPKPVSVKVLPGSFTLSVETPILINSGDEGMQKVAIFLADQLRFSGGPALKILNLTAEDKKMPGIILNLVKEKSRIPSEGYILKVEKSHVMVEASTGAGLFYGIQSLMQLLPPEVLKYTRPEAGKKYEIPCLEIKDHPRYGYRGMHLDVSRHFFPKEFIKRYIDLIAMHKMNTFHWHLTDDNGWRIEIKKYPKLTGIGAWRVDRENLPWGERP